MEMEPGECNIFRYLFFLLMISLLANARFHFFLLFSHNSDFEELEAGTDGTDPNDTPPFTDSNGDGISDAVDKALEDMNKERCDTNDDCTTKVCSAGVCLGPGEEECESVSDCRTGACAMVSAASSDTSMVCCRSGESIDNVCTGQVNGSPCTEDAICASSNCNDDGFCETLRNDVVETSDANGSGTNTTSVEMEDVDEDGDLLTEEINSRSTGEGCGTGCKAGASVGAVAVASIAALGVATRKKPQEEDYDDLESSDDEEPEVYEDDADDEPEV